MTCLVSMSYMQHACGVDSIQCTHCNTSGCVGSAVTGPVLCIQWRHCLSCRGEGMYKCLLPLRKLKNDLPQATAQSIQEQLTTYNAVPAKVTSTGATMPGAEDVTTMAVLKLSALIQRMWLYEQNKTMPVGWPVRCRSPIYGNCQSWPMWSMCSTQYLMT